MAVMFFTELGWELGPLGLDVGFPCHVLALSSSCTHLQGKSIKFLRKGENAQLRRSAALSQDSASFLPS